jgi:two-component system sensor histidine kinase YesM
MLLQPIVENAVFHGLERKIDDGTVRIQVQKISMSQVQYVIQDNGNGMEEKQLQELNDQLRLFERSNRIYR